MKKVLRFFSMLMTLMLMLTFTPEIDAVYKEVRAYAETIQEESPADVVTDDTASSEGNIDEGEYISQAQSHYSFPDEMRSVTITPGYDYFKDSSQSAEITQSEIDEILNKLDSYQMNSIIIDTSYNGKAYFDLSASLSLNELSIKQLIESAKDRLYYVYINLDMNFILNQPENASLNERVDYITQIAHKFSGKYFIDGVILSGYYRQKSVENYAYYMDIGSGIGFENWLLENGAYAFSLVSKAIHKTDNTIPVGIRITNAWANSSENPSGSETNDSFQALTDGFSDTVGYLKSGLADFIMLEISGSISDSNLPFNNVVSWWSQRSTEAAVPMFLLHENEKLNSAWAIDEVVKQLVAARNIPRYQGSAFTSYSQLASGSESTKVLLDYYNDTLNEEALNTELTIVSPTQRTFTTYEPTVKFQGTYDSNFNVYFNDQLIVLNEAGNFYYEEDLKIGHNTFTIRNKSNTIVYKIERKIEVIKSIEPVSNMTVEGKTTINVSAVAYKGSKVSATLNGKTISLTETSGQWEGSDPNSNYAKYVGSFTAPQGIVLKEQYLGNIVITGNYNGIYTKTLTGGAVTISALPEDIKPTQLIQVTTDNALTYNYYTTNKVPDPDSPRLPAGTYDYFIKKVTYDGVDYYLTESKKRILAADAKMVSGYTFGENNLSVVSTYMDNSDTVIKLQMNTPIPFSIKYNPTNYYTGGFGNYYVKNFTATSVVIDFDYLSNVSGTPSMPSGALFNGASWSSYESGGQMKYQLKLNLSQAGIFNGVTTSYSSDGTLTLRFNGYNNSLAGAVFVVDPGHGMTAKGIIDPGAVGAVNEHTINWIVAQKLTAQLQAAGATVYMLPTHTTYIDSFQRSSYARQYKPDMYISIHCNAVSGNGEGIRGTEVHYFMPFSQPLASGIVNNLASFWHGYYGDGKNRNRGTYWNWFAVTLQQDFPSVLVELGFITDSVEVMAMYNNTDQLAAAIVQGCREYYARKG